MRRNLILFLISILAVPLALGGCRDDDGPFEEAGEEMDEAVDELDGDE